MSVRGGEIKVVLTLDDSGFSVKTRRAADVADALKKTFTETSKASKGAEADLGKLSKVVESQSAAVARLDNSLSGFSARLEAVASRMEAAAASAGRQKRQVEDLAAGVGRAQTQVSKATQTTNTFRVAMESLKPSLQRAADGQKVLQKSNEDLAKSARKSTDDSIKAKIDLLAAEKDNNAKIAREKEKLAEDLARTEQKIRNQALGRRAQADVFAAQRKRGSAALRDAELSEAARLDNNAGYIQQAIRSAREQTEALRRRNAEIDAGVESLKQEAKVQDERRKAMADMMAESERQLRAKAESDKQAERAAREASREAARIKREESAMWRQVEAEKVRAARDAAREQSRVVRDAEREFAKMNRQMAADERERKRVELAEMRRVEREKVAAAKQTARDAAKAESERQKAIKDTERQAKAAAREIAAADRRAARESAQAQKEVERAARDAARERKRLAKEAADYEKSQAQEVAQMWRSMGQLWAASKIQRGLGQVVEKGSEMQKAQLRVDILGLSAAEAEEFNKKAFDLSRQEAYLSNIDAINARYTALTSLGKNKVDIIDATLPDAMRTVQALKVAGFEGGSATDIQRNLYGVAEMRQVINDPEATKRTFDTVFRAAKASGGKINVADLETILRNIGPAASQLSDKGILNLLALAEQMKVAGGHGSGGAGTGVSTVGTMVKMMQLYAAGKPMKIEAIEQFMGAGLMNEDAFKNGDTGFGKKERDALKQVSWKAARSAGMKDIESLMADPMSYMKGIREPLMEYMLKNQSTYFDKGADVNSIEAQMAAFTKFFARSGYSHRAVSMMVQGMDPRFTMRMDDNTKLAQQGDGAAETVDKARASWAQAVMEMKAGAENLATAFLPILEPLAAIARGLGVIMNKAADFVRSNPLSGMATLATVAFGGLTLAIRGATGAFGAVGGIMRVLTAGMGGAAAVTTSATTATTAATAAWGGMSRMLAQLALGFPRVAAVIEVVIGAASRLAAPFIWLGSKILAPFTALASGASNAAGVLGRFAAFFRDIFGTSVLGALGKLVSWAGWSHLAFSIGWVVGEWISSIKVGGISIGEHVQNMLLSIEVGWKSMLLKVREKWTDFKKFIGGKDFLGEAAERKELEAERAALKAYEDSMRIKAPTQAPAPPKAPEAPKTVKDLKGDFTPSEWTVGNSRQPREERAFENAFQRTLEMLRGDLAIESLKVGSVLSGVASYEEQAKEAFAKRWLAGDMDDGKDPSKRKFVKGGKRYDAKTGWTGDDIDWQGMDAQTKESVQTWLDQYAALQRVKDEKKGLIFATERLAATTGDADEAARRLAEGGLAKETDAMRALKREFDRQEADNPALKGNAEYEAAKARSLLNRARADLATFAADIKTKAEEIQASFVADTSGALIPERERIARQQNAFIDAEKKKQQAHLAALDERLAGMDKESNAYKQAVAERAEAEAGFNRYLELLARQREEALLKPIQKLAREWANIYDQIEQLESQWASGFLDTLHQTITTGKGDWRGFVLSMLGDISKMMLKDALGKQITDAFGGIGNWLKGFMGVGGAAPAANAAVQGVGAAVQGGAEGAAAAGMTAVSTQASLLAAAFQNLLAVITGNTAATATNTATTTVNTGATGANTITTGVNTTATAVNTTTTGAGTLIEQASTLFKTSAEVPADAAAVAGVTALAAATTAAAAQIGAAGASSGGGGIMSLFGFANGGIMTPSGALDLKAYANGGIANSPQLALFGEGSMNEAFVPLPDGRTIPVTIRGESGGGTTGPITISIVVNKTESGESESTRGEGEDRTVWNRVADRVKNVVREEMAAQSRPGGMLYR